MAKKTVNPRQPPKPANLPAIVNPSPEDYHISLPNTEIGVHREAHVVFMIDMANRDITSLQELSDWYLAHGWYLDVVHVEPEPEKPAADAASTKIEQDLYEKK